MPYIGTSPSNGVRRKHTYTATASQTSFSGAGAEGATLSYTDSNFVDVYQNGVKLSEADYTSTSGTAIVLATGATVSDMIEIVVYDVFSVADTVSKSAGGTFDGNVTAAGTLAVTGTTALTGNATAAGTLGVTGASTLTGALSAKGGAVFNEDSADVDFRVEGNGDTHALFVQGGSDHVGINNNSPNSSFTGADNLVIGGGSGNTGMTILSGTSSKSSIEFSDGTGSDATKTAGGIRYYHASNYMRFNTGGGTERMKIDENGIITKPYQPSFSAKAGGGQTNISPGSNTTVTVSEIFDRNADFGSNTFTAPVEGLYQLNAHIYLAGLDSGADYIQAGMVTSNRGYYLVFSLNGFDADFGYLPITISVLADMDANDTALVSLFQSGGSQQIDVDGGTYFTGYLVC